MPAEPLQFTDPVTVTSELGRSSAGRFQRFRVHPDFWINVFEDGRVMVTSYVADLALTNLTNFRDGSTVTVQVTPKPAGPLPNGEVGFDERNGPPGPTD
jgi:hypothetical protein